MPLPWQFCTSCPSRRGRVVAADLLLGLDRHGLLTLALPGLRRGLHARSLELVDVDLGLLLALALHRLGVLVAHGM